MRQRKNFVLIPHVGGPLRFCRLGGGHDLACDSRQHRPPLRVELCQRCFFEQNASAMGGEDGDGRGGGDAPSIHEIRFRVSCERHIRRDVRFAKGTRQRELRGLLDDLSIQHQQLRIGRLRACQSHGASEAGRRVETRRERERRVDGKPEQGVQLNRRRASGGLCGGRFVLRLRQDKLALQDLESRCAIQANRCSSDRTAKPVC